MNIRPENIRLLEKSRKLLDIALGRIFGFDRKAKAKKQKNTKISKWDYIKLKSFCTAKETTNK